MPSSVIADIRYDSARAILAVRFVSGRLYRYFAVPARIAAGLAVAGSKGRYFNREIRDRYPFEEVVEPGAA